MWCLKLAVLSLGGWNINTWRFKFYDISSLFGWYKHISLFLSTPHLLGLKNKMHFDLGWCLKKQKYSQENWKGWWVYVGAGVPHGSWLELLLFLFSTLVDICTHIKLNVRKTELLLSVKAPSFNYSSSSLSRPVTPTLCNILNQTLSHQRLLCSFSKL